MNELSKGQTFVLLLTGLVLLILMGIGILGYLTGRDNLGWWFVASGGLLFLLLFIAFDSDDDTNKVE